MVFQEVPIICSIYHNSRGILCQENALLTAGSGQHDLHLAGSFQNFPVVSAGDVIHLVIFSVRIHTDRPTSSIITIQQRKKGSLSDSFGPIVHRFSAFSAFALSLTALNYS
jgi:hypothetical protein